MQVSKPIAKTRQSISVACINAGYQIKMEVGGHTDIDRARGRLETPEETFLVHRLFYMLVV